MLTPQIDYLTLNARELTRPKCFVRRATLAQLSGVARVSHASYVFSAMEPLDAVYSIHH